MVGARVKSARLAQISVLVADADAKIAQMIRRVLLSLGFGTVLLARNGEEALALLREKPVDIVITEWDIEPLSGVDFISAIRNGSAKVNRMLPIVMLTGRGHRSYVETARDIGMTEFVVKPFSVRTLCDRIVLVVEHPRNFILAPRYCGPDRRRRMTSMHPGQERRANRNNMMLLAAKSGHSKVVRISEEDITIVSPDFALRKKIGDEVSISEIFSAENVRKAQEIIQSAQGEFLEWVVEDIKQLEDAYHQLADNPGHSSEAVQHLYSIATKIKSQAGTFGFDLASCVAESLMQISDHCPYADSGRLTVIRKHLDALYVIFQRNIEGMGGRIGTELMENLNILSGKYKDLASQESDSGSI